MKVNPARPVFQSRFKEGFQPTKFFGNGTYGSVFAAENIKDAAMKSAVKRIPLEGRENDKVLNEVNALLKLKHDRIVSIQEVWIEDPPPGWQEQTYVILFSTLAIPEHLKLEYKKDCSFMYIQMELYHFSLDQWLSRDEPRDLSRIKRWFEQIVSALKYIHEMGYILRDLKPSNILFDGLDGLKVCDLGIIAHSVIMNASVNGNDPPTSRTIRRGTQIKRKFSDNQPTSVNKKARKGNGAEKKREEATQDISTSIEILPRRRKVYLAPEQMNTINDSSAFKVDMFSLGLILTELCVVMTDVEAVKVFNNYRTGKPNNVLDHLPDVKDLVDWLTNFDHSERPTCEELI